MKLPTHLPERLLSLELLASLIEVSDLNTVIFLPAVITQDLQLLVNGLLLVPSKCRGLPEHASLP